MQKPHNGSKSAKVPAREDLQTRSRILKAASALFGQIGFEATSTKAIAARAHVPSGSIFYHFGTKEALIDEIFSETIVDEMRRAFESVEPGTDPILGLTLIASALYSWLENHADQARILFREITSHRPIAKRLVKIRRAAISQLANFMQKYIEAGALRTFDPGVAAQALGSSLIFAVAVDRPKNPPVYIGELINLMFSRSQLQNSATTETSK